MRKVLLGIGAVLTLLVVGVLAYIAVGEWKLSNPLREQGTPPVASAAVAAASGARNVYFGDLHVHTGISLDANLFDTRHGPRRAYEFAQGAQIELPGSRARQKLSAPLDFAAVTDHAEGMGMMNRCYERGSGVYWSFDCLAVRHRIVVMFGRFFSGARQEGTRLARYNETACGAGGSECIREGKSVWQINQEAARDYYQPGRFTTFVGFEYSPTLQEGGMLHRNVIFRGDKVPDNVFSAMDGFAEDLLRWLDKRCAGECQALTIPHNPNLSWGLMFGDRNSDGTPVTRESLELRARYDAAVEIFQAKGGSECVLGAGTTDEDCNFETYWPVCTAEQLAVQANSGQHAPRCVGPNDLVRGTLAKGLADQEKWGFNPFKFGVIGSTDNHNGAPGDTQENQWNGHGGVNDAFAKQRLGIERSLVGRTLGLKPAVINPGGLAAVWAEANTREAIFDALKRRESYGTSGTRVRLRVAGGLGLPADAHLNDPAALRQHSAPIVPMGGELAAGSGDKPVTLAIWAARDPNSAPLQRVQVVKGWIRNGQGSERVYDVACSDGLKPDPATHRCPPNGAKVDTTTCEISKDKGANELAVTWRDPDFQPSDRAFYYVRVIENPVCRYSQHDARSLNVLHPDNVPATIQERAWSSAIWVGPKG